MVGFGWFHWLARHHRFASGLKRELPSSQLTYSEAQIFPLLPCCRSFLQLCTDKCSSTECNLEQVLPWVFLYSDVERPKDRKHDETRRRASVSYDSIILCDAWASDLRNTDSLLMLQVVVVVRIDCVTIQLIRVNSSFGQDGFSRYLTKGSEKE